MGQDRALQGEGIYCGMAGGLTVSTIAGGTVLFRRVQNPLPSHSRCRPACARRDRVDRSEARPAPAAPRSGRGRGWRQRLSTASARYPAARRRRPKPASASAPAASARDDRILDWSGFRNWPGRRPRSSDAAAHRSASAVPVRLRCRRPSKAALRRRQIPTRSSRRSAPPPSRFRAAEAAARRSRATARGQLSWTGCRAPRSASGACAASGGTSSRNP